MRLRLACVLAGTVVLGPGAASGQDSYPGKVIRIVMKADIARTGKLVKDAGIREE